VAFVGLPGNIALMMAGEQHQPLRARPAVAARRVGGPLADAGAGAGPAEGIGAGIDGIVEETEDGVVDGQAPGEPVAPGGQGRQWEPLLPKPEQDLAGAAEFGEPLKHHAQGRLDPLVRVLLHPAVGAVDVADGQGEAEVAPAGLGEQALVGALAEPAQFRLTHGALEAQEQAVVQVSGVVGALRVQDDGIGQGAQLQELVPVPVVAGQARDLQAGDGPRPPEADRRHEALKACAARRRGAGLAQILVDDDDGLPAEGAGLRGQVVLPAPAFLGMPHLSHRGLADVDQGGAREVLGADLLATPHDLAPPGARPARRRGGAAGPAPRARLRGPRPEDPPTACVCRGWVRMGPGLLG
jgi:hypothetical protein